MTELHVALAALTGVLALFAVAAAAVARDYKRELAELLEDIKRAQEALDADVMEASIVFDEFVETWNYGAREEARRIIKDYVEGAAR